MMIYDLESEAEYGEFLSSMSDVEEMYEVALSPSTFIDEKCKRVREHEGGDLNTGHREADRSNEELETVEILEPKQYSLKDDRVLRIVRWATKMKSVFQIPHNNSESEIECEIHHLVLIKEDEMKEEKLLNESDDHVSYNRIIKNMVDDDYVEVECDVVVEEAEENELDNTDTERRKKIESIRDIRRQAKYEGRTYIRRNGDVVPEKIFVDVTSCCLQECYKKVNHEFQLHLFASFYASKKNKQEQDLYVASMIIKVPTKTSKDFGNNVQRPNRWTYEVPLNGKRIPVCQTFLLGVFQLSQKRIRVIQKRLMKNECTFEERRGKHNNRPHKLPDDTLELFHAHLQEIPPEGRPSPSAKKFSKNLYFTKKKLFELFRNYYEKKTGKVLPMKYNTYVQICNRLKQ